MDPEMSEITKVGKRYAVVVPKPVRKRVALEEGQRVSVRAEGGRIIIEPLPKDPFADLAKLIPDTYSEAKYERKAEELAKKFARTRH